MYLLTFYVLVLIVPLNLFFLLSYLKFARVTPFQKKGRKDAKQNYGPVSTSPTL